MIPYLLQCWLNLKAVTHFCAHKFTVTTVYLSVRLSVCPSVDYTWRKRVSQKSIFTASSNVSPPFQMWDLSTALELANKTNPDTPVVTSEAQDGGPTADELLQALDSCDLTNSRFTTPSVSPAPSLSHVATVTSPQSSSSAVRAPAAEPSAPANTSQRRDDVSTSHSILWGIRLCKINYTV